jgi:hypothetical protein
VGLQSELRPNDRTLMATTHHGVHLFNLILMLDAKTGKPLHAVGMWIAVIVARYDFHFFSRSIKYFA